MIEVHRRTQAYGNVRAVDSILFTVSPHRVSGFRESNGAVKSTTLHKVIGLNRRTRGSIIVNARPHGDHCAPLHETVAPLDAKAVVKSLPSEARAAHDWPHRGCRPHTVEGRPHSRDLRDLPVCRQPLDDQTSRLLINSAAAP